MSFSDILNRPSSQTERPKPLPVGTYLAMVKGQHEEGESAKKRTPFVKFALQLLQAADDVDEVALAEALNGKALHEKTISTTFYVTEDAAWRLGKFLEDLGFEPGDASYQQMMGQAPGKQVMIAIKHRPSEDGTSVFAEVASTAAVGE